MATDKQGEPIPFPGSNVPNADELRDAAAFSHQIAAATMLGLGIGAAVLLVETDRHVAAVMVVLISALTTVAFLHFALVEGIVDFLAASFNMLQRFIHAKKTRSEARVLCAGLTLIAFIVLVAFVWPA